MENQNEGGVRYIVEAEYVGTKPASEVILPIICEEIKKELGEADTFDNSDDNQ